jgi:hypothetical protein
MDNDEPRVTGVGGIFLKLSSLIKPKNGIKTIWD